MAIEMDFSTPSASELKFVRRFSGSRYLLWAMWTKAKHLQQWWGPQGWTTPVCLVDFRPGGVWFYCMQDPDGNRYCGKLIYGEIDAPRRFTGTDVFTDEDGNRADDMPVAHSEYQFTSAGNDTILSNVTRYASPAQRDQVIEMGVEAGVTQTLSRLDAYLASLA